MALLGAALPQERYTLAPTLQLSEPQPPAHNVENVVGDDLLQSGHIISGTQSQRLCMLDLAYHLEQQPASHSCNAQNRPEQKAGDPVTWQMQQISYSSCMFASLSFTDLPLPSYTTDATLPSDKIQNPEPSCH